MDSAIAIRLGPFRSALPPEAVHEALVQAVTAHRSAERSVVLWFAEMKRRRLHTPLGYGTMFLYATQALGFSEAKTCQFLRIAEALERHEPLRAALASGELSWTKAREIVGVVTHESVEHWIAQAKKLSRRKLALEVTQARSASRASRIGDPAQAALAAAARIGDLPPAPADTTDATKSTPADTPRVARPMPLNRHVAPPHVSPRSQDPPPVPHGVSLTFHPEPLARFEALLAELSKAGARGTREELILEGLEAALAVRKRDAAKERAKTSAGNAAGKRYGPLSGKRTDREDGQPLGERATRSRVKRLSGDRVQSAPDAACSSAYHATRSPYQVVVRRCPSCGGGEVATSRGDLPLSHADLEAILEDADVVDPDMRRRASIPPRVRRAVLERDGFRCRAPGCGRRQSLDAHHYDPVRAGGPTRAENLIAMCRPCHVALHSKTDRGRWLREWRRRVWEQVTGAADHPGSRGGDPDGDVVRDVGTAHVRTRQGDDIVRCDAIRYDGSVARKQTRATSGKFLTVPGYGWRAISAPLRKGDYLTATT